MRTRIAIALALSAATWGACGPASTGPGAEEAPVMFEDEAAQNAAPSASEAVTRAEGLLARGEAAEAEAVLREALETDDQDERAHLDLGLALEMQERFEDAEQSYRAALAVNEAFPEALNNLGVLLRDSDRTEEAVASLREAIRVRPGFASAHLNLGLALEDAGAFEEAAASYERVIELAPQAATARIQLGLLQLGSGQRDQALITLRRAVQPSSGNRALLSALGSGLRRAGDAPMAMRTLQQALDAEETPAPPPVVAELALAQFAADHRPDAEATLGALIRRAPNFATAHYLLANMLAARQAFDDAARSYQAYLRAEPDGPHAEQARGRLNFVRQQQ